MTNKRRQGGVKKGKKSSLKRNPSDVGDILHDVAGDMIGISAVHSSGRPSDIPPRERPDGSDKAASHLTSEQAGNEHWHGSVDDMDKEFTEYLRRCCTIKIGSTTVF